MASPSGRRRRRTREDVLALIRESARELFAQRGYAATTTREIARLADVSETLLFRHFSDKATLFGEVVTAPFQQLMDDFAARFPEPTGHEREVGSRAFTRRVHEMFEANEPMLRALLSGPADISDEGTPTLRGMDRFFEQAAEQVERRYAQAGLPPPFDLGIGVRLGLGMIAASVLFRHSLFPDGPPPRTRLVEAIEGIVEGALGGPQLD